MLVKQAVDAHLKEHADLLREVKEALTEKQAETEKDLLELKGDLRVIAERIRHDGERTQWQKR